MTLNLRKYQDDLMFVPLGGTSEIGINLYLYHYKGKWLIVDMGLGFADDYFPGIDIIVPDITFLQEIRKNIVGLVITHAHEDHLGAVQYLWDEVQVPVYTTPFSAAVLKTKLTDVGIVNDVEVNEIKVNGKFKVGPFDLEFINLTHSVPEMQAVLIRTDKGNILHSGDWKFDDNPLIGQLSAKDKLKKIGDEGVLAFICDSTNIFVEGRSGSEGDLQESLAKLISSIKKGMVVVTTFASNIARVYSIMKAAKRAKRKVVMSGTSLWRMYHAAVACGYMTDVEEPLPTKAASRYKKDELVVIATGCQGERFASTNKLAREEHPDIKLSSSDTIIFASKIIPGNETKIFGLFNKFCKNGVEVMTEKDHFVHVSGHPARDEVEEMYKLVRPQFAIPMHGEPMHTHEHCHFVRSKNLGSPIQVDNGALVKISEEGSEVIGHVPTGHMAIDGNFILPSDSEILRMRRRMRDQGLVIITVVYNKKGAFLRQPQILAPGVLDSADDREYFEKLKLELSDYLSKANMRMENEVENKIKSISKRFFKQEIAKEPKIFVQLMRVSN